MITYKIRILINKHQFLAVGLFSKKWLKIHVSSCGQSFPQQEDHSKKPQIEQKCTKLLEKIKTSMRNGLCEYFLAVVFSCGCGFFLEN